MRVRLTDICTPKQWKTIPTSELLSEGYPVYGANGIIGYYSEYNHESPVIAITCRGATCGAINITAPKSYVTGNAMCLDNTRSDVLLEYLYYCLLHYDFHNVISGSAQPQITRQGLEKVSVELHSLDEQRKIIDVLNTLEAIILARKSELQKLDELVKARFVEMFGDPENNNKGWPVRALGELCSVGSSKRVYQNEQSAKGVPFWRISDLVSKMDTGTVDSELFIPEEKYSELEKAGLVPTAGDILVTSRGTLGRCYIIKEEDRFYFQDGMISWLSKYTGGVTPLYLQYLFMMSGFRKQIDSMQAGSTVAYLSIAMLKRLRVMVPKKDVQETFAIFVAQTDKSKAVVQKALDEAQTLFDSLMQQYFG